MELDIGIFAPGYAIHYVLFLLLFVLLVVSSVSPLLALFTHDVLLTPT